MQIAHKKKILTLMMEETCQIWLYGSGLIIHQARCDYRQKHANRTLTKLIDEGGRIVPDAAVETRRVFP